ncbi:hypothetical protein C8J56DRAFT_36351 [Mycena floridula]|nr:hypothetical protein C8J56DRAFT_36351 [Mycena floridula]
MERALMDRSGLTVLGEIVDLMQGNPPEQKFIKYWPKIHPHLLYEFDTASHPDVMQQAYEALYALHIGLFRLLDSSRVARIVLDKWKSIWAWLVFFTDKLIMDVDGQGEFRDRVFRTVTGLIAQIAIATQFVTRTYLSDIVKTPGYVEKVLGLWLTGIREDNPDAWETTHIPLANLLVPTPRTPKIQEAFDLVMQETKDAPGLCLDALEKATLEKPPSFDRLHTISFIFNHARPDSEAGAIEICTKALWRLMRMTVPVDEALCVSSCIGVVAEFLVDAISSDERLVVSISNGLLQAFVASTHVLFCDCDQNCGWHELESECAVITAAELELLLAMVSIGMMVEAVRKAVGKELKKIDQKKLEQRDLLDSVPDNMLWTPWYAFREKFDEISKVWKIYLEGSHQGICSSAQCGSEHLIPKDMRRCRRCFEIYCSKECQKYDWKNGHSEICWCQHGVRTSRDDQFATWLSQNPEHKHFCETKA